MTRQITGAWAIGVAILAACSLGADDQQLLKGKEVGHSFNAVRRQPTDELVKQLVTAR